MHFQKVVPYLQI